MGKEARVALVLTGACIAMALAIEWAIEQLTTA